MRPDLACGMKRRHQVLKSICQSIASVQAVVQDLAHDDVVRSQLDGPRSAVFSWQAAKAGKMAAIKSSASIRCIGSGFFLPPRKRKMASDRLRSHLQREVNIGDASTACSSVVFTVFGCRRRAAESSGKLCWGPSDNMTASSFAAA